MIIGSGLALVGVTIVGASNMIFSDSSSGSSDAVIYKIILGTSNCWISAYYFITFLQWILFCIRTKITF